MSRQELIRLYSEGLLARRDFVRRLTLAGVSAGAAVGYATSLAPSANAAVGSLAIQQDDPTNDYGGPVDPDRLDEAIDATIELIDAIVDFIQTAITLFSPADFVAFLNGGTLDVLDQLTNLLAQLQAERAALGADFASSGPSQVAASKRRLIATHRLLQGGSADEFVADLGDILDIQCELYAGLIPAATNPERLMQLASSAIIKGQQAAFVRILRGLAPVSADVVQPIGPAVAQKRIDEILGE